MKTLDYVQVDPPIASGGPHRNSYFKVAFLLTSTVAYRCKSKENDTPNKIRFKITDALMKIKSKNYREDGVWCCYCATLPLFFILDTETNLHCYVSNKKDGLRYYFTDMPGLLDAGKCSYCGVPGPPHACILVQCTDML